MRPGALRHFQNSVPGQSLFLANLYIDCQLTDLSVYKLWIFKLDLLSLNLTTLIIYFKITRVTLVISIVKLHKVEAWHVYIT